jgi:diacylglycerol kinase family enzyme
MNQRIAAGVTLVLLVLFTALAIVLLLFNAPLVFTTWLGMVTAFFGFIGQLRTSKALRLMWIAVMIIGVAITVIALVKLAANTPFGLIAVVVAALAIGFLGSYALKQRAPSIGNLAAERPILFVNPKSGGGKATTAGIADIAESRGIRVRVLEKGEDLTALARDAIEAGADAVGMAGGDGSLGYVAAATIAAGVPFIAIPAGTRNHFARDLGLNRSDLVGALDAFTGELRRIDYATVNGRVYLNVASLGVYAETVSDPAYRDAKLATAEETLRSLKASGDGFDLRFTDHSGEHHDSTDLIMVSVGPYRISGAVTDIGKRPSLDSGMLGILALDTPDAVSTVKAATMTMAGMLDRYPGWAQWVAPHFEVDSGSPVAMGIDGETVRMDPPIRVDIHAREFIVAVPVGTPYGPSVSPLGVGKSIGNLWRVTVGKAPIEGSRNTGSSDTT